MERLVVRADGAVTRAPVPAELPGNEVTVLQIYGNMTFTGAETLEAQLPRATTGEHPAVIFRLNQQEGIGSSFVTVLERYAQQVKARGGRLMVAGVNRKIKGQLDRTETSREILGEENVFIATDTLGASTRAAWDAAQRWLAEQREAGPAPGNAPEEAHRPGSAAPRT